MGVGKALQFARHDTIHPGHRLIPEVEQGAKDNDWMPVVAARGLVVLGADGKLRTRPGERELIAGTKLRVIRIRDKRNLTAWDMLARFVQFWDSIEDEIRTRGPGPWFLALRRDGLHEQQHFADG